VCDQEKITLVNEDEGQDPLRGYRAKKKKPAVKAQVSTYHAIQEILLPDFRSLNQSNH
jgi:hypothetical protein